MTIILRLKDLTTNNISINDITVYDFNIVSHTAYRANQIYLVDDNDRIIKVFKDEYNELEAVYPEYVIVNRDIMRIDGWIIKKGSVLSLGINGYTVGKSPSVKMEDVLNGLGDLFSYYKSYTISDTVFDGEPITQTYYYYNKPNLLKEAKEFCSKRNNRFNISEYGILTNFINQLQS